MTVMIVAHRVEPTNKLLVEEWARRGIDARIVAPAAARRALRSSDVVVCRLDVLPTLDGIEPGLEAVGELAALGVRVVNPPDALVGAHDKLETARRLVAHAIAHPAVVHVAQPDDPVELAFPVVVKPRHGSWGQDVYRCTTPRELRRCLGRVRARPWFERHGALVQELVEPSARDLRLIVAGARVVGGAARVAAPGEWRSNVSLGGHIVGTPLDADARSLAVAACDALGIGLGGVDIIRGEDGRCTVIEVNGAADFDERYALPHTSIFDEVAGALGLLPALQRDAC